MPTSLTQPASADSQSVTVRAPKHREPVGSRLESAAGLASGVAHELNNILTAVLGYGALLNEELQDQPQHASHAREIVRAGERAADLTAKLMAFSQRQLLAPKTLRLDELVERIQPRLQDALGPGHVLDVVGVPEGLNVFVDGNKLEEALVELAANAAQAMPAGGRFVLSARALAPDAQHPDGAVEITAQDSGSGVHAEVRSRLFDPFVTTRSRGKGLGLGLAVVYGFLKQSGGDIQLTSTSELGTTLTLTLPASAPSGNVVPFRPPSQTRKAGAGETVLVVDDAAEIRGLAAEVLRRGGYRVLVASSASEAMFIASSSRGPIHVLLTDIRMPGSNGLALAEELRHERRGLRVLLMSGDPSSLEQARTALRPGEGLVEKPFTAEQLLDRVGSLVR